MSQTTRRQHYVWRFHLAAWAVKGKVAVLRRDGTAFHSNPANVAVERDFYRLPHLTQTEIAFIELMIDRTLETDIRKESARGWLKTPAATAQLRRLLEATGQLTPEAEADISRLEIEADEKVMGAIEQNGQPYIERLRTGDAGFWPDDEDGAIAFSHFIAIQHLRTKRIADVIGDNRLPSGEPVELHRIWPVMRHIMGANLGFSFFADRRRWRLRAMRAGGRLRFITADQPVMNLIEPVSHDDVSLYYPVSPTVAVLMEHIDNPSAVGTQDTLADDQVQTLNERIFDYSHEQAIGDDIDYLKSLAQRHSGRDIALRGLSCAGSRYTGGPASSEP